MGLSTGDGMGGGVRLRAAIASATPLLSVAGLSAAAGAAFGLSFGQWHDPEIAAGAGIVVAVVLIATGLRLAAAPRRGRTAAEASRVEFFDHAIEGIFLTTVDGRYLDVNPALARIYGYETPDDLIAGLTNIADQLYVDPSRRSAFQSLLRENDCVVDFVSEVRRRDGSTLWIAENARAIRNWAGQVVFYQGTVEDVTERIKANEAMRHALRQTEEASHAKSAFLAAMSHELKTPLNAVLGFSELLKSELLGPLGQPAYRSYAEDIYASGSRLLAVINDILDLARVQADAIVLESRVLTLSEVVEDALRDVRMATGSARPVDIDVAGDIPGIVADPERLRQILCKLLSNAFKFTPDGGKIAVDVRAATDSRISISVADEGIGMAPETIARALEPFGQVDRSLARRFEGAGLGLTIARAMVELHKGELSIISENGFGTTVTIVLPAGVCEMSVPEHSPKARMAG